MCVCVCMCVRACVCVVAAMSVYLVDVVTGSIIFHTTHKAAVSPLHLVHSENWIVVS